MNEVELIRAQLTLERAHATEVARAATSLNSSDSFRQIAVDYLAWVMSRFEERDQSFHDLLRRRLAADDPKRRAVETALALTGTSREVLVKLAGAPAHGARSWSDFLEFFSGPWTARRDAIDALLTQQAKVSDWRVISSIDADSIFDERKRYALVRSSLPAGVELSTPTPRV